MERKGKLRILMLSNSTNGLVLLYYYLRFLLMQFMLAFLRTEYILEYLVFRLTEKDIFYIWLRLLRFLSLRLGSLEVAVNIIDFK